MLRVGPNGLPGGRRRVDRAGASRGRLAPVLLARCGHRVDSRGALLASRQQRTPLVEPRDGFHRIELVDHPSPPDELAQWNGALRRLVDDATVGSAAWP